MGKQRRGGVGERKRENESRPTRGRGTLARGEGREHRSIAAAIIRLNYRAVSPFGELLTLSLGRARSLHRSPLNPVANLYHDWTSYRRTLPHVAREWKRQGDGEFAHRSAAKVSTTTTTTTTTTVSLLPFEYTADIPNRLGSTPRVISGWCPCIFCERVKNTEGGRRNVR